MAQIISAAKRRLLDELKRDGSATAGELAAALGLTDVAVRQHLTSLEADGLVADTPGTASGRGRPATSWALSAQAQSLFPDNHAQLSVELIDAIRRAVGEDGLRRVVDARADAQVDAYMQRVPGPDTALGTRARALARLRTDEGYMAEVVRESPDRFLLVEHHCPICEAATACTGICRAEWDVFRRVLGDDVSVERVEHQLTEGSRCVYRIERVGSGVARETAELMRVLLVASYELGHQPLQVAAPAAQLERRGHDVRCLDLSVQPWDPDLVTWADRVAFSVPMHTAMRIARHAIALARQQRPGLPVACFGLYGPFMGDVADFVVGGETDAALVGWIDGHDPGDVVVRLGRDAARAGAPPPARHLLPDLEQYAHLAIGKEERLVGYVEASHGCAHRCRHCPVPVIYDGRLRIVDADAVVADAAQQIAAGARHLTFGDPDFLNGAHHSMRVVRAVHKRFPDVTFDCTVKVEHVLRHADLWAELAEAGCLFVVSAFESVDDATLLRLDKGHAAADAKHAVALLREHGIEIRPSWLPFTPWTTLGQLQALLDFVADHDLVGNVDPVQYTIRLLLPTGSLLLEHPDLAPYLGPYDAERSTYTWHSADPAMDALQERVAAVVEELQAAGDDIPTIYQVLRAEVGLGPVEVHVDGDRPRLTEPWFCCAEPNALQLGGLVES